MPDLKTADAWLDQLACTTGVGCAYGVTRGGEVLHIRCAGMRKANGTAPVTPTSVFRIYSITKLFTCTLAQHFLREGKLSLDARVSDFLPEYAYLRCLSANGSVVAAHTPLTVRHLLTMTSGIPYNGYDAPPAGQLLNGKMEELERRCGPNGYTARQLAACIASSPLAFEPGSQWLYGYGHDVLGAVLEQVGGAPLDELLAKEIFRPLSLKDTGFAIRDPSRMCDLFTQDAGGRVSVCPSADRNYGVPFLSGGGGLLSTLEDMMIFSSHLASAHGLWSDSAGMLSTPCLSPAQLAAFPYDGFSYGFGARILVNSEGEGNWASNYEFGWYGVSGCWMVVDRAREASIVFLQQLKPSMDRQTFPVLRRFVWSEWGN